MTLNITRRNSIPSACPSYPRGVCNSNHPLEMPVGSLCSAKHGTRDCMCPYRLLHVITRSNVVFGLHVITRSRVVLTFTLTHTTKYYHSTTLTQESIVPRNLIVSSFVLCGVLTFTLAQHSTTTKNLEIVSFLTQYIHTHAHTHTHTHP